MKQIVTILLLGIYAIFNTGLVVNTHYCGNKIVSVSVYKPLDKSCTLCGKRKMSKDCCKDTQTQLSMDNIQLAPQTSFKVPSFSFMLPHIPTSYVATCFSVINKYNYQFYALDTGPPKTPIYIKIQSLII